MTRALRMTRYLTVSELAERINWPDRGPSGLRRLRRWIHRREKHLGKKILVRPSGRRRGRYVTTEHLVREYMPEMVSTRDEVLEKVREMVAHLEEKIAELDQRDRAIGARVRDNRRRLEELERTL